jgi:hypothetical protein
MGLYGLLQGQLFVLKYYTIKNIFYLVYNIHSGSEAHPVSYKIGTVGLFPWR